MDNTFAVGDKVTWTHVSSSGRTMSMTLREGTITALDGDVATIQPPSKKSSPVQIKIVRLRKPGQRSQITEFIEGVRAAHAPAPQEING